MGTEDLRYSVPSSSSAVSHYGSAESLNLGTAAGVCIYESARNQRMLGLVGPDGPRRLLICDEFPDVAVEISEVAHVRAIDILTRIG